MKRPNILFYFVDQQRWDTIGCYGQKLDVTPNLDALARDGVRFEHAFTPQPVCGPARACLQTGQYATAAGVFRNGLALDPGADTIAKRLGAAGYETAYVGKWHLATDRQAGEDHSVTAVPPQRCGGYRDYLAIGDVLERMSHGYNGYVFDKDGKRMDFTGYRADCITDFAIDYIRGKESEDPFLLFLSHIEPHQQNDRNCYEGPDGSRERFAAFEPPADLVDSTYPGDWREHYPDYLGCCHSLDYNLGRLVNTLKAKGIYEDTVIIYTSDHGNHFKTRDGEYKRQCFDSCLRVPLIIRGGPFRGGKTYTELVSLINLPPTLLELAGLQPPEQMPERSLLHLLADDEPWQDQVFYQISESELARGIRTRRYKYCVHAPHVQPLLDIEAGTAEQYHNEIMPRVKKDSGSYQEQYLFDLVADPLERNNLVTDPACAGLRAQLRERLARHMVKAGEGAPEIAPWGSYPEKTD